MAITLRGMRSGQVRHECARTTEAVRRAIQRQQESLRTLARRFGVGPTTIQKWRKRTTANAAMGPKEARSTVLTPEQEAMVVAFRKHMLLPLADCLYASQPGERMRSTRHLTRSTLHRYLERRGSAALPPNPGCPSLRTSQT